jgi:glycosyltransferase involved in cell wall biosynthesis
VTAAFRSLAILGPAPPDRGGIARETARLARELRQHVPVSYLGYARQYPRWLDPRRFAEFPPVGASPAVPLLDWRSPASWRKTAEEIARARPEALLVPWWTAFWGVPVRTVLRRVRRLDPSIRRVLICHNVEDHEATGFHRFLSLAAFFAADGFFVHSEWARVSLERIVPARPVGVHPLPADEVPRPSRDDARRRLGIDRPLVLFLGLVRRYKGVDVLLSAAPRIVEATGALVAIVGESFPDAEDVERQWRDSPARKDVLRRDAYVPEEEMSDWLAACDVLVLPYRKISGSAIAARALAARLPIAAARVGALAETVVPGVTGELFEAGDADGLARAVAMILSRGLGAYEPGLDEAARRSSWPSYATALLSFLSSIGPGR